MDTKFSIWGGVYLEGAGRTNTIWEKEDFISQNNNHWIQYWDVQHPLKVQTMMPNSLYRENTQVMASFKVQNQARFHFTPSYNITMRFTAYKGDTALYSTTKSSLVIPANGDNLVYFKWAVSLGLNGANITIKGEIIDSGKAVDTKSFVVSNCKRAGGIHTQKVILRVW